MEGRSKDDKRKSATAQKEVARDNLDNPAGTSSSLCQCAPTKLNPKLWSKLPQHLVDCIYARLPYIDFFRLRSVCKRWNNLLSSPKFLQENAGAPFPEPWFLVTTNQFIRYLLFDPNCKSWTWLRLPNFFKQPWAIGSYGGLLYAIIKDDSVENLKVGVFDPRTKVWKDLPPLANSDKHVRLHGMVKEHRDAQDYMLILVTNPDQSMESDNSTTQVYDSHTNAWTASSAKIPRNCNGLFNENTVCCNGALYAYNEQPYESAGVNPELDQSVEIGLITLNMDTESWNWVAGLFPCETPLFQVLGLNMSRPSFRYGLFSWQGHVYAAAKSMRHIGRISFSIWQLEESEHAWKEVDQMPWDHFNWLSNEQDYPNYGSGNLLVQHNSFQCRNLVLICGFLEEEDLPFKFVLYDLHKKEWHRLDVPLLLGRMASYAFRHSLSSTSRDTEDSSPTSSSYSTSSSTSSSSGNTESGSDRDDHSIDFLTEAEQQQLQGFLESAQEY